METRPPTVTRILVAIGFALSCFALALFLWIAFGGPLRHGLVELSCNTAFLAESAANSDPFLKTLQQLSNVPTQQEIADHDPSNCFVF